MGNIQADVQADTTNGAITLQDISGKATAGTTNGAIRGTSMVGGDWTCTTTNGLIRMDFTDGANVRVVASTTNGSLQGNVPWQKDDKHHGTATLGSGAHEVNLRTINGSVTVNRH